MARNITNKDNWILKLVNCVLYIVTCRFVDQISRLVSVAINEQI